jgi:parvulin-like peptidyl-prolyl cis-trans isomerase-like protein
MQVLREPLLLFLLLGAGLFIAFGVLNKGTSTVQENIVITAGQIAHLTTGFTRTWQRPPTLEELEGLIQDSIREEVFYREALTLGLDRDDTIIRRRLRQKMEFISDDFTAQREPTEDELRAYLAHHPDTFRAEQRLTFSHIYFNPERRGHALERDVQRLLDELRQAGGQVDVTTLGDSFLLAQDFQDASWGEVARVFGKPFATHVSQVQPGTWQGPITSAYGVHLVFLHGRTEGYVPALDAVRDAVRREWANARRREAHEQFYQRLRARYTVRVEPHKPADGGGVSASEVR